MLKLYHFRHENGYNLNGNGQTWGPISVVPVIGKTEARGALDNSGAGEREERKGEERRGERRRGEEKRKEEEKRENS
jgi:hypothetical protein